MASAGPYQVCTSLQTDNHASTPPLTILNSHLYWSTSVRIDAPKNEYLLKWIFTVTWSSGSGCYVELVREWTTGSCILVFCVNLLVPVDWTLDVLVCWHMITNACCRFVLHPSYTCLTIGGKNASPERIFQFVSCSILSSPSSSVACPVMGVLSCRRYVAPEHVVAGLSPG